MSLEAGGDISLNYFFYYDEVRARVDQIVEDPIEFSTLL